MIGRRGRGPVLHVAVDGGSGPIVIFLHGIASSWVTFQNVLPLVEDRHRCIAIDLLGFGGSPIPTESDYSIEEHARAVERTLKAFHLRGPVTLVGHSMGALIAARIASRRPKRFEKVVLVSPPIYLAPTQLSLGRDKRLMEFHLRAYRYIRSNPAFTLRLARRLGRVISIPNAMDLTEANWVPFVKSLQNSIESQTTISDLAAIRSPVEIVYGNFDEFHSEAVFRIVERMRGVRVHRVLGSDHLIGKRLARAVSAAIG
jgi:pimeloyl-ACP methyl ester carboxylesterase